MIQLRKEYLAPGRAPIGTEAFVSARLNQARIHFPETEATRTAAMLMHAADDYTKSAIPHLGVANVMRDAGIKTRFQKAAIYFDAWEGIDVDFKDPDDGVLPDGEIHNAPGTRRSTMTGVRYEIDENGLPIHPYLEGLENIRGRAGGLFGVNGTVDTISLHSTLSEDDGREVLNAMGIINKAGHFAPAGGYIETTRAANGLHYRSPHLVAAMRVKEVFEEMISGSIDLRGEFAACAEDYPGMTMEQKATQAKWDMVQQTDPGFVQRLSAVVGRGQIVAQGPNLLSSRVTLNSWGETSASWFEMRAREWSYVKGADEHRFDYDFQAGDDARDIHQGEVGAEALARMMPSHRPYLAYMMADYILARQAEGADFSKTHFLGQAQDMMAYFDGQALALNQHTFENLGR